MYTNNANVAVIKSYCYCSYCQSSIFLCADWSKPCHVPVHKTSCSLHAFARRPPVNNEIFIDRSTVE